MIYYVYKTTNLISGKIYIGKHQFNGDTIDRNYLGSGKLIKRAILKYGKENFSQEILEFAQSAEELCVLERKRIKQLNSLVPNGYNIDLGGAGGGFYFDGEASKFIQSYTWQTYTKEEHDARVKKMLNGLRKPEVIKKISEKMKERHKSLSEEDREKLVQKQKDGWTDEARESHRKNMIEYNKKFDMKTKLILKYGDNVGIQKYNEWLNKLSKISKSGYPIVKQKIKKIIDAQKSTPFWHDYQKEKAKSQHYRSDLRKNKISKKDFDLKMEELKTSLSNYRKKIKEYLNDRNNSTTI